MDSTYRCKRCNDVIGVYEPSVLIVAEQARVTSRAAEPHVADPVECYHHACYVQAHGSDPRATGRA